MAFRRETDTDPEQCVEGTAHVSSPVPAEHELVKVTWQMAFAD
jgi:hypothetical protein